MNIQSVSRTARSTRVVLFDVKPGDTDRAILAACGPSPRGYIGDHTIRRTDDYSGEVARQSASVVFYTD